MAAVQGRDDYDLELRIRRADGEYRWFKARATPVRDDGRIVLLTVNRFEPAKNLGLAIGMRLACLTRGIESAGDFWVGEAGLAGGGSQGAQVGGGVGVQGAVGGPVQAGVAVAFALAGDPAGQVAEVKADGLTRPGRLLLASRGYAG